ncbi:hypothetical protein AB0B85_29810 [Micromonospora sp. NPDC049044]|uniref:hypothetical protein n=1 Tax=unclassified Micromonospora TaxID=2617518 RepID=UPI003409FFF9
MAEQAKKVAQQTEERLEDLAETVRKKFDKVTDGTYRDRDAPGQAAEQGDHGGDKNPTQAERKQD